MRTIRMVFPFLALAAISCGSGGAKPEGPPTGAAETAVSELKSAPGHDIQGKFTFIQMGDEVHIVGEVSGVSPGLHGLHLHETGDCSSEDFTSAGPHFNPTGAPHACSSDEHRHAGDFGNIEIAEDGTGRIELTTKDLTVTPGPNSVVGRAVVLHADPDDCTSQPAGDSGARIACGVVHAE